MSRCLREPAPVNTHGSPPGAYWYQIGTVERAALIACVHRQRSDVRFG